MNTRTGEQVGVKYFTADLHISHRNLCRGESHWDDKSRCRDFDTLVEMNETVLKSINNVVGQDDELWILGDFTFGDKKKIPYWRSRIVCRNTHLVYGNHDDAIRRNPEYQKCFSSVQEYKEIYLRDKRGKNHLTVLFHYYIAGVWNKVHKGSYHLLGHSHGNLPKDYVKGKAFDIGWDVWKAPLGEYEICDLMDKLPSFSGVDHHQ